MGLLIFWEDQFLGLLIFLKNRHLSLMIFFKDQSLGLLILLEYQPLGLMIGTWAWWSFWRINFWFVNQLGSSGLLIDLDQLMTCWSTLTGLWCVNRLRSTSCLLIDLWCVDKLGLVFGLLIDFDWPLEYFTSKTLEYLMIFWKSFEV